MISFFTVDSATGRIRIVGHCQTALLGDVTYGEGEVHIGVPPEGSTHFVGGEFSTVVAAVDYRMARASEYPPLADFMDAVYWQSVGDDTKMCEYLAEVSRVKALFPKS
jgi:hypothetical protein